MTVAVTLIVVFGAIFVFYRAARGPNLPVTSVDDVVALAYPIDLSALATLTDETDQHFLAQVLSPEQLATYHRRRKRLQRAYLLRMMKNCALLMRLAETAESDPALSSAARELKQSALNCRLNAIQAIALLYLGHFVFTSDGIAARYEMVRAKFFHYCMVSAPTMTSRALQVV